jgi:hypothetical protein
LPWFKLYPLLAFKRSAPEKLRLAIAGHAKTQIRKIPACYLETAPQSPHYKTIVNITLAAIKVTPARNAFVLQHRKAISRCDVP